jgi:hypothetical protein
LRRARKISLADEGLSQLPPLALQLADVVLRAFIGKVFPAIAAILQQSPASLRSNGFGLT